MSIQKRASAAGTRLRSQAEDVVVAHPPKMSLTHPSAHYKKGCVFYAVSGQSAAHDQSGGNP